MFLQSKGIGSTDPRFQQYVLSFLISLSFSFNFVEIDLLLVSNQILVTSQQ